MFCIVIQFCLLITFVTTSNAMNNSTKVWIRTSDKKTISLPIIDSSHSCLIETLSTAYHTGNSRKNPTDIWISKEDILLFQKILHTPSLYQDLKSKKYFNALRIAERLRAPFLYTALLNAQLPPAVSSAIAHKYICRQTIYKKMYDVFAAKTESEQTNYWISTLEPKWCIEANIRLTSLIYRITLPQAAVLMAIHSPNAYNTFTGLQPHMPGYDALTSWEQNDQDFLFDNLPVIMKVKKTKLGNLALCGLYFNT